MKHTQLILLAALLLLVGGCSRGAEGRGIVSNRPAGSIAIPAGPATDVEIPFLLEAPAAYEGDLVRLTGQYRRAPVIFCDELTRLSPATWMLSDGTRSIPVRGYETLVQPLLPTGLTMTVEGVWRHWRGPVGCGKDAPVEDVWYLQVTNIVSPSPVARVTLTPAGVAQAPSPTPGATEPAPVGTPVPQPTATTLPTGTSPPTATPRETTPTPEAATQTPQPSPTQEPAEEEPQASPTATTGATATAGAEDTATATASATPTATSGASGPTVTPTRAVVDMGQIEYQDLRGDFLSGSDMHSWQFEVRAGDTITINVASRLETDMRLVVLDPAGNRIVDQNNSGAGDIEIVEELSASVTGAYRVLVSEAEGRDTDYLMLLLNDDFEDFYSFSFVGVLSYGSSRNGSLNEENDQFWFFYGNAGDHININLAPGDNRDLFLDLYDPNGDAEVDFHNEAGSGGTEQLLNFQLPTTGLYAIRVGEINYEPASYTILVARN